MSRSEKKSSSSSKESEKAPAQVAENPPILRPPLTVEYSGPLPDPRTLDYYERVCPGAARDILEMAKLEQKARHNDLAHSRLLQLSGQLSGLIVAVLGIGGGIYLVATGKSLSGLSVFVTSLAGLFGASLVKRESHGSDGRSSPSSSPAPPARQGPTAR